VKEDRRNAFVRSLRIISYLIDITSVFVFLKIYKLIDRIKSNTAYSDLQFLFFAARDGWGKGEIVEIGAFNGKSTVALALGAKLSGREKVTSIDPHYGGTEKILRRNGGDMGVDDYVAPKITTSEEAKSEFNSAIRLMFIDGNHEYDFIKKDIVLWKDLVIEGGIIAFHDYNWLGVARAIDEEIRNTGKFAVEGTVGCTLIVSKMPQRNAELFEKIWLFNRLKSVLWPPERRLVKKRKVPNV